MNEYTKELGKKIASVRDYVTKIFDIDAINQNEPKLKSDLKDVNYNSAKPLLEQLDKCDRLMKSPIYVGMLGRYSHGKSALVNALFLLDEGDKLPEGESVVTSKITRVAFDDTISSATAFKHFNGDHDCEMFGQYSDFQKAAQSKDDDNSTIAFLEAKIPVGQKLNLAKNFFDNNIQLIDMPGLGGPYFDDSAMVREYVENVDMVVVAIKITEIEESAAAVNKFLQKVNCPKIAVLTFYDLTEKDNKYASCGGDMAKILAKAKQEVEKHFTNLGDTDDIIVVSNKQNALVDKVRERILQKITVQNSALGTKGHETPIVEKQKVAELKKELDILKQKALNLPKSLETLITTTIGKDEDNKIDICTIFSTSKIKNKQQNRAKGIDKEIKSFKKDQVSIINSITSVKECDSICEKIKKDEDVLLDNATERFDEYKSELKDIANDYITNLNVSEKQKSEFKKTVKEILDDYSNIFEDVEFDDDSVKREATYEKAKGFWRAFIGFLGFNKSEKEAALKAKDAMKTALNKSLTKFEKDIFKKIEDVDNDIQDRFRKDIDVSALNKDIQNLIRKKDSMSEKIDDLLEVIETVKYKI